MDEKKTYRHSRKISGSSGRDAETEHRDTARLSPDEQPNELSGERRDPESRRGPTTHADTRIDPDPLFEDPAD